MECKSDDRLANRRYAPEKAQTLIPTPDQDQEGDGEGKKAEAEADADADGTIDLLLEEILVLRAENRQIQLQLDNARNQLPRFRADDRSLRAQVQGLEKKIDIMAEREEELQQVVKALEETKTRLEVKLAGFRSQIYRHLEIQGEHDAAVAAMARGMKVSWVAAAVASAVAVAVSLRNVRQR